MQHDPMDQALSRLYDTPAPTPGFDSGWRAAVRREELLQVKPKRFSIPWGKVAPVLTALVLVVGALWAGTLEMDAVPQTNDAVMLRSVSSADMSMEAYDAGMEASPAAGAVYSAKMTGAGTSGGTQMAQEQPRKLVRTASLTLRTQAFDQAVSDVEALLEQHGGYVENLYQYGESLRRLSLSLRVPSDRLDAFLQGADGLGRVTDRSESTVDMTVQYADNAARLETLYAKRDRLNALLQQAENVADLIEIESAIADTQYQIDSYETSQRSIDRRVDMSAVELTLMEEKAADAAASDLTLGQRLSAALSASVEWLGEFCLDALVFVTMILPVAGPIALIWLAVWFIRRRNRKEK